MLAVSPHGVQRARKVTGWRALRGLTIAFLVCCCIARSNPALGHDGASEAIGPAPVTNPSPLFGRPGPLTKSESTAPSAESQRRANPWVLSLEAVTHAPVDFGVQIGGETPFGLHLVAGVGLIPPAYSGILRGIAASATSDVRARALLLQARYAGSAWRVQVGMRPFKQVGLYLDGGYARVAFSGSVNLSQTGDPDLAAIGGTYDSGTALDMWLIELGYQGELENRLLLGMALGVMGTLDSHTTLSRSDGGASDSLFFSELARRADRTLESYGIIPTLTLRIGVDLL